MTPDLKTIADALGKLQAQGASEDAKRTEAMTRALQSISAALTNLVEIAEGDEKEDEGDPYASLVEAMRSLRIEAPAVSVAAPTVNVEAPTVNVPENPVALTVQAGPNHNHVTVPEPKVTVLPATTWGELKVSFEYRGDMIVGATVTRT
jgi:hypothetical protein